jgi:hypothetical protein
MRLASLDPFIPYDVPWCHAEHRFIQCARWLACAKPQSSAIWLIGKSRCNGRILDSADGDEALVADTPLEADHTITAQPKSAASSSGTSRLIFTTEGRETVAYSANTEQPR